MVSIECNRLEVLLNWLDWLDVVLAAIIRAEAQSAAVSFVILQDRGQV